MGIVENLAKKAYRKARAALAPLFTRIGTKEPDQPTMKDLALDADAYTVKLKLGRSFFTRQLNPNTRVARIRSLTPAEFRLALNQGWVKPEDCRTVSMRRALARSLDEHPGVPASEVAR